MFTGIIKELGAVRKIYRAHEAYRMEISSHRIFGDVDIGDSVAVNGACLTLVEKKKGVMGFDVMEETTRRSGIAGLKVGDVVNLEGALKANGTLGGHFVLAHVDCIGMIRQVKRPGGDCLMEIAFPTEFAHLVVEKGSVAIDGVSLTVGAVKSDVLSVYLIPHTLKATNLGSKRAGDSVNIEFDIIGKHVARFKSPGSGSRITEDFLKDKGF